MKISIWVLRVNTAITASMRKSWTAQLLLHPFLFSLLFRHLIKTSQFGPSSNPLRALKLSNYLRRSITTALLTMSQRVAVFHHNSLLICCYFRADPVDLPVLLRTASNMWIIRVCLSIQSGNKSWKLSWLSFRDRNVREWWSLSNNWSRQLR